MDGLTRWLEIVSPEFLQWEARRLWRASVRRFGLAGVAALGLALLVGVVASAAWHLRGKLSLIDDALVQQHALNQKALEENGGRQALPPAKGLAGAVGFQEMLPSSSDIPGVIERLLSYAGKQKLELPKAEYHPQADRAGGFLRFQMLMPVKGTPVQVLAFVNEALANHATLALESIQLRRERSDSQQVEARVQWVLLVRADDGVSDEASASEEKEEPRP